MKLATLIAGRRERFAPLFDPPLKPGNTVEMTLSASGNEFADMDEVAMDAAVFARIDAAGAIAGVGGYLEDRAVYRDTDLFQGDAERSIHIGVDVFMPAGTPVCAPLDGEVQSFANRQVDGDYGPVIILRHRLDGIEFHTLYGHLTEASLDGLQVGAAVTQGQQIAAIGARPLNGNWTPHLHFQLIRDMGEWRGDYPGVVRRDELDYYRDNCPRPDSVTGQLKRSRIWFTSGNHSAATASMVSA